MEYKISNDLGLITISEDVLLKVAGYAALECYGIVAMSSKRAKDGFVEWLGKENLTKGVQVNITEAGIDIDLFISSNTAFPSWRFATSSNLRFATRLRT